jgi:hypothetical protein
MNSNKYVKIFILDMEKWFQFGNKLIKVEQGGIKRDYQTRLHSKILRLTCKFDVGLKWTYSFW